MIILKNINDIDKFPDESYWLCKNDKVRIIVYFVKDLKVCIKKIKELQNLIDTNITYAILIYASNITSFAKQAIKNEIECPVQLFTEGELAINITKHVLVPKHELVSIQERNAFLNKHKYKLANLPRILDSDPVIKYLYGKPGDMVKITRDSETTGTSIYYRIVYPGL